MKNNILGAAIVAATLAIAASLLSGVLSLPAVVPVLLRWLALVAIAAAKRTGRAS